MSQYRGQHRGAPQRIPVAILDGGEDEYYGTLQPYSSAQYWPPQRGGESRQYNDNQSNYPSYSPPPPRQRPHPATRPYAVIDDRTGDYYYLNPEEPPQYYSVHPNNATYSPESPPPPLRDVVWMEVARGAMLIIPSLVTLGLAKLQLAVTRIKRETPAPAEVRVTVVETINRQAQYEPPQARQVNQDGNGGGDGDETNESINVVDALPQG